MSASGLGWPWALALVPIGPLWLWRASVRARRSAGTRIDDRAPRLPTPLSHALDERTGKAGARRGAAVMLRALAWIALVLAVAQPWRAGEIVAAPVSGRALALAIDLSGSMEREDFELDGARADRLEVVKRVAGDFLARRTGDRVGLVLFGKEAFVASPLTFDLASLRDALDASGIGMAGRSTAIGDALGLALSMLRDDPAPGKAVVLLSDGTNNAGAVEPEDAAALADELGVRVHTIALASDAPGDGFRTSAAADLDEGTLEAIAERAGGRYFRARTRDDLVAIYTAIDTLESAESAAPPSRPRESLSHWPTMALFALLLLLHRRERGA